MESVIEDTQKEQSDAAVAQGQSAASLFIECGWNRSHLDFSFFDLPLTSFGR